MKQARFNHRSNVESTKQWCRRRGLEEQRFYELTKLRNQFQELLKDFGLVEKDDDKQLSSGERAIRHGELRQLKEMKRAHKFEAPRKRKLLKNDSWSIEDNDEDDKSVDMRDVDFRLSHDSSKISVSFLNFSIIYSKTFIKKDFFFLEFGIGSDRMQLQRFDDAEINSGQWFVSTNCHFR